MNCQRGAHTLQVKADFKKDWDILRIGRDGRLEASLLKLSGKVIVTTFVNTDL